MDRAGARAHAIQAIGVDVVTASVVSALRAAEVRSILLKGPTLAGLLYAPGELRRYVDVDLLVASADEERASRVLRGLGFGQLVGEEELGGHRRLHAHEWVGTAGVSVDLHRTLPGAAAPPERVVEVLMRHTRPLEVAGAQVEALAPSALLVQVALHAAHHGPRAPRALDEVARAVAHVPLETWELAASLAGEIDAVPAFATGVRLAPGGDTLADRLSLTRDAPVDVALKAAGAPPLAVGLDWLLRTSGPRAKAALLVRTAFPSPGALRLWRPLARRGRSGLVAAYATHPFWLARHAVPSALALRRARAGARRRKTMR